MPNAFVHIELNTSDLAASKKFYKGLFAWELTEPMPGYTMIGVGGTGTGGGMGPNPTPGAPTQWLPYVEVDSVKKTIAKAKKRGATIVVEYQPIPNMGALGVFVDPTGATLGVWESSKVAAPPAPQKAAAPKKAAPKKAAPKKAAPKKAPKKKG